MSQPPLKTLAFGDLHHELATTRRLLERVSDEHFDWRPHEKSMDLGALVAHMVNLLAWIPMIAEEDHFDLTAEFPRDIPTDRDQVLAAWDAGVARVTTVFDALEDTALLAPWTLRRGDQVIFTQPRLGVLRGMGIGHLIHHRGQLSVYFRQLDIPLPPIYGPTADEQSF